ncbi:hypothetical protein TCAL_05779 [Tigriopus californicus]|uniref:Uncharacterized protein n=1 Tax=Tigriopus californicus TaxID=6832 RepID=A0A553NDN4_TIGCA|nr:hypothetical protein TCAL_05779 [Tigriopus californicus]|eukprot:TCALIF_05779-PA protein Name:"Similar to ABCC1 Multidrug resistance-associated protein 1 (Gallus gallus)" AED:0.04 eAED:0.04 QI:0/0/0/1/1/1/2/0/1411
MLKLICTTVLIANVVIRIWNLSGSGAIFDSEAFHYGLLCFTFVLAFGQEVMDKFLNAIKSLPLFSFWFVLSIVCIPDLKYEINQALESSHHIEDWALILTYYPIVFGQFLLNCRSDLSGISEDEFEPPENSASYPSLLTFSWLNSLIWKGFKAPLTLQKLPKPPKSILVSINVQGFLDVWTKKVSSMRANFENDDSKFVSVFPVLWKCHWPRMLLCIGLSSSHYLIGFISPQILKLLVNHVASPTDETWKGYLYVFALFFESCVWTFSFHMYCQNASVLSIQMRSSMMGMVFQKTLRLSNLSKKHYTSGEITNYMSVDAQRLVDTIPYLSNLWCAPLTIGLAQYFLYQELGAVSFAGIGTLFLLMPINLFTGKWVERLQADQLRNKDERIKLMSEILGGIKVLKLYAWENPFMRRLLDIRDNEIKILRFSARLRALINFTFFCSPILVTISVFGLYVLVDCQNTLTAEKIFVSMSLLNMTRYPLIMFPWALIEGIKLIVSLKRINKFLNAKEMDSSIVSKEVNDTNNSVEFTSASFAWNQGSEDVLTDIDLKISSGALIAVVGMVGSGKSSLLSALLGEMEKTCGTVSRVGSMAYVPQQAWIQNMTLKQNILFENDYNESRYNQILDKCQLKPDMAILKSGDETEIGENGINLSGGQKQRVSLARAVYHDADLYLLDDPLSAVDALVGKNIFDEVLSNESGCLKDKTRVLVTHNLHILPRVDHIVVMRHGKIAESGSYDQLKQDGGAFAEFLENFTFDEVEEEVDSASSSIKVPIRQQSSDSNTSPFGSPKFQGIPSISQSSWQEAKEMIGRSESDDRRDEREPLVPQFESDNSQSDGLLMEESAFQGSVRWSVFLTYFRDIGFRKFLLIVVLFVSSQICHSFANYWLSRWADVNHKCPDKSAENILLYLGTYSALGMVEIGTEFAYEFLHFLSCAYASKLIHERLLERVMHSPMSFFDTNPMGRILNRFSVDVDSLDQNIPSMIRDFLWCLCDLVSIIVIITYSTPWFSVTIIPLGVVFIVIQSKSPVLAHFSETITGAASIRGFQQQERFINESETRIETSIKCFYLMVSCNRWLGVRMELLGNVIVFFAALFVILKRSSLSPGVAGLSISYSLNIMDALTWMVRMVCELETNFVALERILEYTDNPQEAPWDVPAIDENLPQDWPVEGKVLMQSYHTRYREGLDLVLKGIDLEVKSHQSIGICGRTGAGKSSLSLALFRIIEACHGNIFIDGVDISYLGLHRLRSCLTIIPQDPILFTGSVRFNLDPTYASDDSDLWHALGHVHLKQVVEDLSEGLEHQVAEGGVNFSLGQRQLICLARALLRKTKILILDEATAAIDLETDNLIQATIREEFKSCTVLTIAHRLNTIMDNDKIVVLSNGRVLEYDTPNDLLSDKNSTFSSMAKDAGL